MSNLDQRCWICSSQADSAEHMIKASQLENRFPDTSDKKPFFKHTSAKRNIRVTGVRSQKIKFSKTICSKCNNAATQSHDRAWDKLSNTLRSESFTLKRGMKFPLTEIFGDDKKKEMKNVYLYLLKLFGCCCAEYSVQIPFSQIGCAIQLNQQHPDITISFF